MFNQRFYFSTLLVIAVLLGLGACTESPSSTSSEEAQAPAETVATGIQFKAVDDQIYTIEPGEEIEVDGVLYSVEDGEVKATRIQQEVQTPEVEAHEPTQDEKAPFMFKYENGQLVANIFPDSMKTNGGFHVWKKYGQMHHAFTISPNVGITSDKQLSDGTQVFGFTFLNDKGNGNWETFAWGDNAVLSALKVQGAEVSVWHAHSGEMLVHVSGQVNETHRNELQVLLDKTDVPIDGVFVLVPPQ